jgi:hypothetical protein
MIIWARIETEPNYIVFQLHQHSSIIDTIFVSAGRFAESNDLLSSQSSVHQKTQQAKGVLENIPEKHRSKTHELPQM